MLPDLKTERLLMRPAVPEDLDALVELWDLPEVRRYLFDNRRVTREWATEVLNRSFGAEPEGLGMWMTQRIHDHEALGMAALLPVNEGGQYDKEIAGLAEPTIVLHPNHWRQGYGIESLRRILSYGFRTLGLRKIAGVTDLPNGASDRMLRRAGFRFRKEVPGPAYRVRTYMLTREIYPLEDSWDQEPGTT